jgi:hypothetical protein
MPFKKGQSGNPSGRPKRSPELKALLKSQEFPSIRRLIRERNNLKNPPAIRIAAANSLLDRSLGRPTQVVHSTVERRDKFSMSDAELQEIAAGARDEDAATPSGETTH